MFSLRTILISLIALLLVACSTVQVGRDFDLSAFEVKVERGVTSQIQIRELLGDPTSVGVNVDAVGERWVEWTYYFASGNLNDMSGAKVKILQIKFDAQKIVRSYNWSNSDQ